MKISLFKRASDTRTDEEITISDFISGVKYGRWEKEQEAVRAAKTKDEQKRAKEKVPAVTIGGTFSAPRNQDNLKERSGFIAIDIDNQTDLDYLKKDPYTYAYFESISGGGRVTIVKTRKDRPHKDSFRWVQHYYFEKYGITVDSLPQNIASLRFVSHDPNIFINEKSRTAQTKQEQRKKPRSLPIAIPQDKVGQLVSEVVSRGIDLAPNYETYRNLGFALANGFGSLGEDYFHALCQVNPKYDSRHAKRQWEHCLKRGNRSGITVGTFYYLLKENGIDLPKDNKPVQVAAMAKRSGREKEGAISTLVELHGLDDKSAFDLVEQVYNRDDINLTTISKDPDQLIENMVEWIAANHQLKRNLITQGVEENGIEVRRDRFNTIYLRAKAAFNSTAVTADLVERIIYSEFIPNYNPIKDYIEKYSTRCSSTGNIDDLAATIKTDTPNAGLFIRKWLIGVAAAVDYNPVRSVLALTGGQNTGKTEWFRRLLPKELKRFYAESKLDAGKDDELLMTQKLIVMDDEMGGKSKQDEKRFKELTSKRTFSLRPPYGRSNEDFNRLAVLCGTSNERDIINDLTGNTRILPINVISINHAAYNEIDKNELFMEAVRAYEEGESWELTREQLKELQETSKDFESTPFERELILKFFKRPDSDNLGTWMTATDIKDILESRTRQQIRSMKRFGIELKNVFGDSKAKRINGTSQRCYFVVDTSNSQSTENEYVPF